MIAAPDAASATPPFVIAPAMQPHATSRRAGIASAALVMAVSSVPQTNPAWTAIVSHARIDALMANSCATAGAAAVAENHSVMPRNSATAIHASIRRGI